MTLFLLRNVTRARQLLAGALNVAGRPLVLPANADHELVETLKRTKAHLAFAPLDSQLAVLLNAPSAAAWLQPVAGLATGWQGTADRIVLDYADTVPMPLTAPLPADALLFGLHLSPNAADAGALLVIRERAVAERLAALVGPADAPEWARAAWQLQRLSALCAEQAQQLATLQAALTTAAGLPTLTPATPVALAHGVAVQIPAESTPSTFYHYVQGEQTPISWLPLLRPLHPAALAQAEQTAQHLERWLLAPVGPATPADLLAQTALGVVKAAEYLGVRWRTDPQRAAAYAALLTDRYGPGHDAYRPIFAVPSASTNNGAAAFADFAPPACRIPGR